MQEQFVRTELLVGTEAMERLAQAHVAIFGIGGVGGHAVEALVRSGVGQITIIDDDVVCESNLNRQLIATKKTVGMRKVTAMYERIMELNPNCKVTTKECFYLPEIAEQFKFAQYDYVIDAIDTITAKIDLAVRTKEVGTPFISSMGAGNKLDPTKFEIADISETSVCPLAKVMRKELKKRGIETLKVVYSKEQPRKPIEQLTEQSETETGVHKKRATPGSIAFVPAVVGLIIAGEVIKDLMELK